MEGAEPPFIVSTENIERVLFARLSMQTPPVGRCKLDPSLKGPCFQTLFVKKDNSAFNLNLVSELAPPYPPGAESPFSWLVQSYR